MSIRKPAQSTITIADFRNKVYTFTVESVLGPGESPGVVVISTSAGYLLTSPLSGQPRRELIIRYKKQVDTSWLVNVVIDLTVASPSPVDGTVIIQDSHGETTSLTVSAASELVERFLPSTLTVSQSSLTFAGASPGKPGFQVLAIAQPHTGEPITLTTDAPEYFQLASDNQPVFSSSLTITPSATGTYVHVRYMPGRRGVHRGQLLVSNPHESQTVALEGRSSGLLAMNFSPSQPAQTKWWAGALALALIVTAGLAYSGYSYRCQLFPALCQEEDPGRSMTNAPVSTPAHTEITPGEKEIVRKEKVRVRRDQSAPSSVIDGSDRKPVYRATVRPAPDTPNDQQNIAASPGTTRTSETRRAPASQVTDNSIDSKARRQTPPPVTATEESELERELNRVPPSNP